MKLIVNFWDKELAPDKDLLGGKGASLVQMTQLRMPVPPGFILTTHAWRDYDAKGTLSKEFQTLVRQHLTELEKMTGTIFGSSESPLLVSVRSGARYSMPGMMDTISNVGVNRSVLPGLSKRLGNELSALDSYCRFLRLFGSSVYGIHIGEFDLLNSVNRTEKPVEDRLSLADAYHKLIFVRTGKKIPDDPFDQLFESIEAVFRSWYNPGAVAYRQLNGIPDQIGTAANIQMMVYGNKPGSGTGVLFTRDTATGENKIIGDYLTNAQGDDIVRGGVSRKTQSIDELVKSKPKIAKELIVYAKTLERIQKDAQDMEFTIEDDKLWLLQIRSAKRTPLANIRIAKELFEEKIITESQALRRIRPSDIEHVQLPTFDKHAEETTELFSSGVTASPGVGAGSLALNPTDVSRLKIEGKKPILICDHIDPNDIATLLQVSGVVTTKGSASSHMALIMRSAGIPGVVGASSIDIDVNNLTINSGKKKASVGTDISVNATKGLVYNQKINIVPNLNLPADITKLLEKRTQLYTRSPWSAGIFEENGSPNIPELVVRIRNLRNKAVLQWKSEKTRVIEVLDKFFDDQTMIKFKPIKPQDKIGLEKALLDVLQSGYFNGPRTCHSPTKLAGAPWVDGPNSVKDITAFLTDPDYPGKYGGYLKWIQDPDLDAILVAYEKEGKLDPDLANHHFACTLSCVNGLTTQLVINVILGTPQLRALERVESSELATIKINLNPEQKYSIGDKTYHLGRSYLDDNQIELLAKVINENRFDSSDEVLHRTKRHLLKQLTNNNSIVYPQKFGTEELKDLVFDLMNKNMLPADVFHWVVNKKSLSLLEQISHTVLETWWRGPIYLPHIMAALDEVSGLSVLEAQGRFENDKIIWFKIYGAKGSEERDRIKNWKEL